MGSLPLSAGACAMPMVIRQTAMGLPCRLWSAGCSLDCLPQLLAVIARSFLARVGTPPCSANRCACFSFLGDVLAAVTDVKPAACRVRSVMPDAAVRPASGQKRARSPETAAPRKETSITKELQGKHSEKQATGTARHHHADRVVTAAGKLPTASKQPLREASQPSMQTSTKDLPAGKPSKSANGLRVSDADEPGRAAKSARSDSTASPGKMVRQGESDGSKLQQSTASARQGTPAELMKTSSKPDGAVKPSSEAPVSKAGVSGKTTAGSVPSTKPAGRVSSPHKLAKQPSKNIEAATDRRQVSVKHSAPASKSATPAADGKKATQPLPPPRERASRTQHSEEPSLPPGLPLNPP